MAHDECTRDLLTAVVLEVDANDGGVADLRVRREDAFEFGGCDLQALVLDEFLIKRVFY
jgi:hypothetical protein